LDLGSDLGSDLGAARGSDGRASGCLRSSRTGAASLRDRESVDRDSVERGSIGRDSVERRGLTSRGWPADGDASRGRARRASMVRGLSDRSAVRLESDLSATAPLERGSFVRRATVASGRSISFRSTTRRAGEALSGSESREIGRVCTVFTARPKV
jgi:hypothetical protein